MPKRGVARFDKRGKLSSRYIGPFEVLERVGTVAYRLVLPPNLSGWASLSLMRMEPSRRDQYVSWIAGTKFYEAI